MSTMKSTGELMHREESIQLRTGLLWSLYGVWYRHVQVYRQTFLANLLPPVMEPLFFFTAVAFGLGPYLPDFDDMPYRTFIASGIVVSSAMFTGVFETTFGTFIRLVFQRSYDAMLGTHLLVGEMFTGELLFCATKGFLFSMIVMVVTSFFGVSLGPWCALVPFVGAMTGYIYGALGLIVCSYVRTINNFNFFITGVVSPMFFLSGTFFPIHGIYSWLDILSYLVPLTHSVKVCRMFYSGEFSIATVIHLVALVVFLVVLHLIAIHRMRKRVVL